MQIKESYLWTQVKSGLERSDTHLSRIENSAGTGISDVSACHIGQEIWIELKVFHSQRLHFRNSQRSWITRRIEVGGMVVVVARQDDWLYAYRAKDVMSVANVKPESNGKSFSILKADLPDPIYSCRKPFKWDELREAIFFGHGRYVTKG